MSFGTLNIEALTRLVRNADGAMILGLDCIAKIQSSRDQEANHESDTSLLVTAFQVEVSKHSFNLVASSCFSATPMMLQPPASQISYIAIR